MYVYLKLFPDAFTALFAVKSYLFELKLPTATFFSKKLKQFAGRDLDTCFSVS
jgi:hypothetical protein